MPFAPSSEPGPSWSGCKNHESILSALTEADRSFPQARVARSFHEDCEARDKSSLDGKMQHVKTRQDIATCTRLEAIAIRVHVDFPIRSQCMFRASKVFQL